MKQNQKNSNSQKLSSTKILPRSASQKYQKALNYLDQVLLYQFDFDRVQIKIAQIQTLAQFFKNNKELKSGIANYFVQMLEDVCSICFRIFVEDKLTQTQMKCYASKNLLQNISQFCLGLSNKIRQDYEASRKQKSKRLRYQQYYEIETNKNIQPIKLHLKSPKAKPLYRSPLTSHKDRQSISSRKYSQNSSQKNINPFKRTVPKLKTIQEFILEIVAYISDQIKVVLKQIIPKYPKAPWIGYSSSLKQSVKSIDFRQNYQLQLLYLYKITIRKKEQDPNNSLYVRGVMQFINRLILTAHEPILKRKETYLQCFQIFTYNLSWLISKPVSKEELIKEKYMKFLIEPAQAQHIKCLTDLFTDAKNQFTVEQLARKLHQEIQVLKKNSKVIANSKISKQVPKYEDDQILHLQLKIKHSAILRILTKWVEDLQETLKQSQRYIKNNQYYFKDQNNERVQLNQQQRLALYKHVNKAFIELKNEDKEKQKQISCSFINEVLTQEQAQKNMYRFQRSLKIANQVNAYIANKTAQRLFRLFDILVKIPWDAAKTYQDENINRQKAHKNQNKPIDIRQKQLQQQQIATSKQIKELKSINLVCNRLGDLLRSTIYCSEQQFIKLLSIMYQLDKYCSNNKTNGLSFFKIIRIKDKLKDPINNVHINYMFFEKIQCQLQIYFEITQNKHYIQKNNTMNHFLFELERGIHGTIAQLSTIIKQYDYISISKKSGASIELQKYPSKYRFQNFEQRKIRMKSQAWRCINKFCKELSFEGDCKFIKKDEKYYCLKCYSFLFKCANLALLKLLRYEQEYISQLLSIQGDETVSEVSSSLLAQKQDYKELYLVIYPTERKVRVGFFIVYYSRVNACFIIKSLDGCASATSFTKSMIEEHEKKIKFYLKINNNFSFRNFLQRQSHQNSKMRLKQMIGVERIKQQIRQGSFELSKQYFEKQIANKNIKLKLDNRLGIPNLIQNQSQLLDYVEKLSVVATNFPSFDLINKFPNLLQLNLSENLIQGEIAIPYPQLIMLNLSRNRIAKVSFVKGSCLKHINLTQNTLNVFESDNLTELQNLQLQNNHLKGTLSLIGLKSLTKLNINYNNLLQEVNIKDSWLLKSLYCKKINNKEEVDYDENIENSRLETISIFHEKVELVELISVGNMIKGSSLQIVEGWNNLQKLILEVGSPNFQAVITTDFPKLHYLTLHFQNLLMESGKMQKVVQQLIYRHKLLTNIEFVFKNCNIVALNLSELQRIQSFTLLSESEQHQQVKFNVLQELKLSSVEKLVLIGGLNGLQLDWGQIKYLSISEVILKEFLSFETVFKNRDIQTIKIYECNLLNQFLFSNFPLLKNIDIHLTTIFGHKSPYEYCADSFKCINNSQLKNLSLGLMTKSVQIRDCPQLKQILFHSQYNELIEVIDIKLIHLEQLSLSSIFVNQFILKLSTKAIKRIYFKALLTFQHPLDIQFYQKGPNEKLDLQELEVANRHLSNLANFVKKINSIDRADFVLQVRDQQYLSFMTSQICRDINKLTLVAINNEDSWQNKNLIIERVKVTIDSAVSVLYLPINVKTVQLEIINQGIVYIRENSITQNMAITSIKLRAKANNKNSNIVLHFQVIKSRISFYQQLLKEQKQKYIKFTIDKLQSRIID